ncbi:MAG: guanylate kinase [bacterium]|nr:guanylate kinase [bacterium]
MIAASEIKILKPTFFVISGPSGSGKTTVRNDILENIPGAVFSISMTTRKKRSGEQDGFDYIFVNEDEFKRLIDEDHFNEWELIHGDYYGTPIGKIKDAEKNNNLLIFDVDVKGGLNIKNIFPEAILVYLKAPSVEVLRERLTKRDTNSPQDIDKRLTRIKVEDKLSDHYDWLIININKDETLKKLYQIIYDYQKS